MVDEILMVSLLHSVSFLFHVLFTFSSVVSLISFLCLFLSLFLLAQNSENVYIFFLRNKQSENQNNRKQVQLKDKQRQLCHWRKHSLVDSSSSDDASSSNEQVILFLSTLVLACDSLHGDRVILGIIDWFVFSVIIFDR
jgi:hypothetical protein